MAPSLEEVPDILREVHAQAKNAPVCDERGYSIRDGYLGTRRPLKVLIIGFGAAAINICHVLGSKSEENNISIQCYEKNPEVGGTWYENRYSGLTLNHIHICFKFGSQNADNVIIHRYPGCACDIVHFTFLGQNADMLTMSSPL